MSSGRYQAMIVQRGWEIAEGKDFFNWHEKVDWIITNPPYSIYDKFLKHCFEVADNVVLLVPIVKAFKSIGLLKHINNYGGLKEIWIIGSGTKCGFKIGFPVGCLYYQRDYSGLVNVEYDFVDKNQSKLFTETLYEGKNEKEEGINKCLEVV